MARPQAGPDRPGHPPQRLVAGEVAIGVVVGLEPVDVDHDEAQQRLAAARPFVLLGEGLVEGAPVGEPRQPVLPGERLQPMIVFCEFFFRRLARRNVAHRSDEAGNLTVAGSRTAR